MTNPVIPIVGAHFRPPAKQILKLLPAGATLTLVPEPENPYDPGAIMVLVSPGELRVCLSQLDEDLISRELVGSGFTLEDLEDEAPEGGWHLGYVPRSGAKTAAGGPGNLEIAAAFAGQEVPWQARLAFLPTGAPALSGPIL